MRFEFLLCRTLGNGRWMHPDEMREEMPHRWVDDWLVYYQLDPWGEERADMRMAREVWSQLQPHSKKKLREQDYLFDFRPKELPTPEQYQRKAMRAFIANGGKISAPPKGENGDGQGTQQPQS